MKIKAISSPTLRSLYNEEDPDTLLTYRFTVDVKLYDDGDRRIDRKPNSFPEKPFTYLEQVTKTAVGFTGEVRLHRSMKWLDEVEFDRNKDQPDMFGNECEGMCGV